MATKTAEEFREQAEVLRKGGYMLNSDVEELLASVCEAIAAIVDAVDRRHAGAKK